MAERRMFAKTIIDSDAFLDMPQSSQLLYFHLSMRADDEGFINNPKSIMRNVRCTEEDILQLINKKFIIPFETGIVVIKHWKIHNYIRNDRFKPTKYQDEKTTLALDENNAYTTSKIQENYVGIPSDNQMDTQDRLGKVKKESKKKSKPFVPPTLEEVQAYCESRGNKVDAKQFFDYYDVSGWIDGKGNEVKNWKQKFITWENNRKENPQNKVGANGIEVKAEKSDLEGVF